jgi:hypothetical protein
MNMNPTTALLDDTKKRFSDFVQKDYELKVAYLTNHFQRMWTRFNYFVLIEAALIGGKTIFGDKAINTTGLYFGLALSLVWYLIGAQDCFLVKVYRDQVKTAGELLAAALWQVEDHLYRFVGDTEDVDEKIKLTATAWRFEPISITKLPSLIPLAVSFVWFGLLVITLKGSVK